MSNLGQNFYKKLIQISSDLGMKPEDILNVMALESGINPAAHNKNGNASGLVQFMPSTLKSVGFKGTHSEFRNLSGEEQLDYVKRLIQGMMGANGGPFTSAAQYYIGNFVPAALRIPGIKAGDPKAIICSKNPEVAHIPGVSKKLESLFYTSNPVLDVDKDGSITFGDIQTILNRVANQNTFKNSLVALQQAGYTPSKNPIINSKPDNHEVAYQEKLKNYNLNGFDLLNSKEPMQNSNQVIDQFLQQVNALEKSNLKLYKKFLTPNNFVIKINSANFTDGIEFGRILSSVLEEEFIAKSFIHTDENEIDLEGEIYGDKDISENLLNDVCSKVERHFNKIANKNIRSCIYMNTKSNFEPINIKLAYQEYKKFMLKF